jgi:hypothetical protein
MTDRHKTPPLSIRLPEELREWLEAHAAERKVPISHLIVAALSDFRVRRDPRARVEYFKGGFNQEWRCEPPPYGARFKVLRDEWAVGEDRYPLRIIHEAEIIS